MALVVAQLSIAGAKAAVKGLHGGMVVMFCVCLFWIFFVFLSLWWYCLLMNGGERVQVWKEAGEETSHDQTNSLFLSVGPCILKSFCATEIK